MAYTNEQFWASCGSNVDADRVKIIYCNSYHNKVCDERTLRFFHHLGEVMEVLIAHVKMPVDDARIILYREEPPQTWQHLAEIYNQKEKERWDVGTAKAVAATSGIKEARENEKG